VRRSPALEEGASLDLCAALTGARITKRSNFSGCVLPSVTRGRRTNDLQLRLPAPRTLQLENRLAGLDFVDEIRQPAVAAAASQLNLWKERSHSRLRVEAYRT
jgi:hypothetical protein